MTTAVVPHGKVFSYVVVVVQLTESFEKELRFYDSKRVLIGTYYVDNFRVTLHFTISNHETAKPVIVLDIKYPLCV